MEVAIETLEKSFENIKQNNLDLNSVKNYFMYFKEKDLLSFIKNWYFEELIESFKENIFINFYKKMKESKEDLLLFEKSIDFFHKSLDYYLKIINIIQQVSKEEDLEKTFILKIQSIIYDSFNLEKDLLYKDFKESLQNYLANTFDENKVEIFKKLNDSKFQYEDIFIEFTFLKIEEKIKEICNQDGFSESKIEELNQWMNDFIYKKLKYIKKETKIFENHFYKMFTLERFNQLFDIIVDYPDSVPVIKELKECLIKTNLFDELVSKLSKSFENRLLIPGANTNDIISQYINTIRTLSILDPTGVSLSKLNPNIKNYLKKRPDGIKCIINGLIDEENGSELHEELMNQENVNSDSDSENENWEPESLYPNPLIEEKSIDIIKKILEMYGNKELFIKEYHLKLSELLLAKEDFNIEKETKILEFLKIRFGEKNLISCEIMLKDIMDSKRINNYLPKNLKDNNIQTLIISKLFWPNLQENNDIKLHPKIMEILDEIQKTYFGIKAPRTLIWYKEYGNIELSIEIGEKEIDINVNPLNASIIFYFLDQKVWNKDDLSKKMNCDITKYIGFWIKKGFLIETEEEYTLVDEIKDEVDEIDDHLQDIMDQEEVGIEIYESIIINMLMNFGMDISKIHNSLKMFAMDPFPPYEKNMNELSSYLDKMVLDGKLISESGIFKLKE